MHSSPCNNYPLNLENPLLQFLVLIMFYILVSQIFLQFQSYFLFSIDMQLNKVALGCFLEIQASLKPTTTTSCLVVSCLATSQILRPPRLLSQDPATKMWKENPECIQLLLIQNNIIKYSIYITMDTYIDYSRLGRTSII